VAILATCLSWVWWITFVESVVVMGLFQVFWCTRQSRAALYGLVAAAGVCSASSLAVALHIASVWSKKEWCWPWSMGTADPFDWNSLDDDFWNDAVFDDAYYDDDWYSSLHCPYIRWSVIPAVCGFLWGVTASLMFYFVKSGRHAKWEEKHGKQSLISSPHEEEFELSGVEDPSRKPEVV